MLPDNGRRVTQHLNYHMTMREVKVLFQYVRKHHSLMYEIALLLMVTRGMRPSEALSLNILDFSKDFNKVTWREAKTNKIRANQVIIKLVAERIACYVRMNAHRLKDGYLFPFYTKKSHGLPFMDDATFSAWFAKVRKGIGKMHPSFLESYRFSTKNGQVQTRYRVSVYSLRRFHETYFYVKNNFNLALLKEIMDYGSGFDPMKHYIRVSHSEDERGQHIVNTFNPLALELIEGQRTLSEFCT